MSTEIDRPEPERTPRTDEFLDGLAAGEIRLPECTACGRVGHPGIPRCRHCMSDAFAWRAASGRGTLFSHVVISRSFHPAFEAPYEICVIELEEGPRLVAQLAGVTADELGGDAPVRVDFSASGTDGVPLRFVPAP